LQAISSYLCPRSDTHLTYVIDIPLTTEFALTQVPGGDLTYAAPEAERSPGHRGGETVRAGLRP
jgi:hypothetical protein